jgi:tripartite-type tricarboxylate transporter receptor subunit TctC
MPMPIRRRTLLASTFAASNLQGASAQPAWPERPIRLIVPFGPGGATDIISRLVADRLAEQLGQPIVIENRGGAGGNIGAEAAARAAPDGYTLVMGVVGTHAINPTLFPSVPFDPIQDFSPISLVATAMNVLVVNPDLPARSVQELIALARARPGQLNFGSPGNGSTVQLAGELFKTMTGTDMVHTPYRGAAAAMTDLLAGRVHLMFDNLPSAVPHVRSGRLRALAVTGAERSTALPELPTVAESGLPGYEATTWFALFGPARLPPAIVARLNGAVRVAVGAPGMADRLGALGAEPAAGTPEALTELIRRDTEKWGRVIRLSGARVD